MSHLPTLLFRKIVIVACLAFELAAGIQLHAQIFDAFNDFATASDPNGAWSYGTLSSVTGGTFTPLTIGGASSAFPVGDAIEWSNGESQPNLAVIDKNETSGSIADLSFPNVTIPSGYLRLDGESFIDSVRWTAPVSGLYNITGNFMRIDSSADPVEVGVIEDGTSTLFSFSNFTVNGVEESFDLTNQSLTAGTTLDFVENGAQFAYDSTGLQVTIGAAPEPGGLGVLSLLVAIGMIFTKRFRSLRVG